METNIDGLSNGTGEIYRAPKSWTQRTYRNITYFNEGDEGGNFAAWEEPELFAAMRHDLKPFIFVINNSGYTVERAVLGKDAKYNDVANWRYSELPNLFSRDKKAETYVVQTSNEWAKTM